MRATNRRWTIAGIAFLAIAALVPVTAVLRPDQASAAVAAPGDGTTSATAGASCWGIKQQFPASANGTFWLLTKSMDRPAQFSCDMTTSGGGWVLVARGREGWTLSPNGQGSPATVRDTTDGRGAFAPAALDTTTIDNLLDHANLSTLPDGVRLERARTADGGTRQDYRLYPKARSWTWNLSARQLLDKVVIDGTTYIGSNTYDTSAGVTGQTTNQLQNANDSRRMFTFAWTSHNNKVGFSYGSGVSGSNSSSSYLWTYANEGLAIPFTRVWVRPQIANGAAGFTPIPAEGYAAQVKPVALKNRSEIAPWGVSGYNHTNEDSVTPWINNVMVIKVYGDRVYVGGRFTGVQQGPTATPIPQASIAAFDLDGNWIPSFHPVVVGRVWDMTMTNDGKLIIGGDFTSVDSVPDTHGLAALDPITGAVSTTWKGSVDRTGGGNAIVRALDSRGDTIYAAGRFNLFKGGASAAITTTSAISMKVSNGGPGTWRPKIYATAVRIQVSNAGDRVYMAGFFNSINSDTNHGYYGITNPTTGAVEPGIGPWQASTTSAKYQQAVAESGDNILVGGSQHDFQMYDHNRNTLLDSTITRSGGDTQAIEKIGNYIYFACHCLNWVYQGTNNFSSPNNFRAVDPIRMVGRVDATTFDYDTTWFPNGTKGQNDAGIWSISSDSRDCLWVGGDLVRGAYSGNAVTDYLGGFARFCPTDSVAPTAPTALTATANAGSVDLAWTGSTDAGGTVSYDIYRDDRVIATVFGTTYSDGSPGATGTHQYTVRAADTRGNRSASPAPISINGPAPTIASPVSYGSTWRYADRGTDLATAWRAPSFDDSAWTSGPGTVGWGGGEATTVGGSSKPITTYLRSNFTIDDASQVKVMDIEAKLAQGAIVYVNGVEVGRVNLPAGAVTGATPASTYTDSTEDARVKTFRIPGTLLTTGTNSLAVELHAWKAGATKAFFDLQATTRGASSDTTAPSAPALTATPTADGVSLSWTPSTDETALGGYTIARDGAPIAVVGPLASTFTDVADITVAHTYMLTAFDSSGNTASASASTTATANPKLLAFNSTWSWWYQDTSPNAGWQNEGYEATTWNSGAGELGFGDTPKATITSVTNAPRPVTAYYRRTVDVADPSAFTSVAFDLIRNAGAVLYVNGVEVGRSNMPSGTITSATYALSAPAAADRHEPVRIAVPTSAFHPGTNTIAVEVHLNYRSQPTSGFDLKITGLF